MRNFLLAGFVSVVFSLYLFPFEFDMLPGINTKMILAAVGLMLFGVELIRKRSAVVGKDMLWASILAVCFSLMSYLSVVYNNTSDMAYATYFISMWVWTGGAYCLIKLLRKVHNRASLQLVFHYFAIVCVAQLVIALIIDYNPSVRLFVDTYVSQDEVFLHEVDRLYGIGASFDTAGIRFSCSLLGLGYLITHKPSSFWLWFYWAFFFVILVLGNMMSRTTTVGVLLSVAYIICYKVQLQATLYKSQLKKVIIWFSAIAVLVICLIVQYEKSPDFQHNIRYAFEGFFNYFETGEWETSSTNRLMSMMVWPDNIKTWLIGDGLFDNPDGSGFYKHTDVGYLRLIYYCGLIGLLSFIMMFLVIAYQLCYRWPRERLLIISLVLLQGLVWIKISTDVYQILALLLMLQPTENTFTDTVFFDDDTENNSLLLAE